MAVTKRSESGDHFMLTHAECKSTKVKVRPKRGSAIFWYNHVLDKVINLMQKLLGLYSKYLLEFNRNVRPNKTLHLTPGRRQSKTPIQSTNVDKKSIKTEFSIDICRPSIETEFSIVICRLTGDK